MSTLPSLCREEANDRLKCLNRSMHEDIDHNLTYSYSSSEDSLNESFSINFTPKKPRSAVPGVRSPLYATPTKVKPEMRISTGRQASAHLQHLYPGISIVIVEPREADCCWRSAEAGDGEARSVTGEMVTIMAGLCCGVPSVQGWPVLRRTAKWFLSCEDSVTSRGMRVLYSPLPGDSRVVSGESGAVCLGALYSIMSEDRHSTIRTQLGLHFISNNQRREI